MTPAILEAALRNAAADLRDTRDRVAALFGVDSSGPNGLTPDAVKFHPDYQWAKRTHDRLFVMLRAANAANVKSNKRTRKAR